MKRFFGDRKVNVSHYFVIALAIVSIVSFFGIVSETLLEFDFRDYVESILMFVIGAALIVESKIKKLKSLEKGLTPNNFAHLITVIIGAIAVFAGIFSFPPIKITTPAFLAVKGIISIIAMIIIIIQTWVID